MEKRRKERKGKKVGVRKGGQQGAVRRDGTEEGLTLERNAVRAVNTRPHDMERL